MSGFHTRFLDIHYIWIVNGCFSFANVWIQSGVAAICAALTLKVSEKALPFPIKMVLTAALGWIGMGIYQTYAYMIACSLTCSCFVTLTTQKDESIVQLLRRHAVPAVGTGIAVIIYFITNLSLKLLNVLGFEQESRVHGIRFISQNASAYVQTIFDTLNAFNGPYAHYESRLTVLLAVVASITLLLNCRSWVRAVLATFILIVGYVMLPNPTNALMKIYWASPRSLSPVALPVALVLVAAITGRRLSRLSVNIGIFLLGAISCSQLIIYVDQQKSRADQQAADFVTVSTLVNRAYADFPADVRPLIKMNLDWRDNTINRTRTYEFGETLLNSPAHQQALIAYLSGGRVDSAPASSEDCASAVGRMSIEKRGNALLVCAKH